MTCQNPSCGRPITEPLVQDSKLGIAKAVVNRNNQCQVLKHNLSTALLIARDGHFRRCRLSRRLASPGLGHDLELGIRRLLLVSRDGLPSTYERLLSHRTVTYIHSTIHTDYWIGTLTLHIRIDFIAAHRCSSNLDAE